VECSLNAAIVREQTGGFYVECGALDGERSSNTLYLERSRQWTGLLVEVDPYFYTQLLGKNRNSWSINACLSPKPYVTQVQYRACSSGAGSALKVGAQFFFTVPPRFYTAERPPPHSRGTADGRLACTKSPYLASTNDVYTQCSTLSVIMDDDCWWTWP